MTAGELNIWIAVSDDKLSRVKEIVKADKAQANAQDQNGYSPLHAAASWKRAEIMQFLIDNGADVNIKDSDGDTPLHICEDKACAEILLASGADPEAANDEGMTPVMTTLENEAEEVTKVICDKLGVPVPSVTEVEEPNGEQNEKQGEGAVVSEEKLQDLSNWIMQQVDDKDDADEDALREMVTQYILKNLRISKSADDDTAAATIATSADKASQDANETENETASKSSKS